MGQAGGFLQRMEQRVSAKALVELTQVVEGDLRARQCGHALLAQVIGQVTQHAIPQTFMGHATQLLLDCLDRVALLGLRRQTQRIGTGEPAHAAGQVDVIEQGFAAMAFQLDQCRGLPAPAAQYAGQGGQQQVVDLGAIGTRRLLQQLPGALGIQAHANRFGIAIAPCASGTLYWQGHGGAS